ncbi:MAG: hypothetical protein O3B24_05545 [Verrucomicrobia bacterium]|nr:hypothetical protein [Verrucomicrobiota bacterium]
MFSRLYSIVISSYKDTSRQTLEACLGLTRTTDAGYEVIFLDNTRDSRHQAMSITPACASPCSPSRGSVRRCCT